MAADFTVSVLAGSMALVMKLSPGIAPENPQLRFNATPRAYRYGPSKREYDRHTRAGGYTRDGIVEAIA